MLTHNLAGSLVLALIPSITSAELLTITQYPSNCASRQATSGIIYTSGSVTYTVSPTTAPTASTPVDPTPLANVCPDLNGQNYTSPSSGSYAVHCDVAVTGTRLANIQARQAEGLPSRESCLAACQQNDACIAINIGPSTCEYYSNVTGTTDALGFAALVRLAVAPTTSVYSATYSTTYPVTTTVVSTLVSTYISSVPYTTTAISTRVSTALSTTVSIVPTTVVSTYVSTAISLVPTTVISTSVSTSLSTLVTTVDQTRFVTEISTLPVTVVSTYISTTTSTTVSTSLGTTTSLVPTTIVSTQVSSYPVTTVVVSTATSLVPTTIVETYITSFPVTTTATSTEISVQPTTLITTQSTTVITTESTTVITTATPSVITLPNNLGSQFGGVDATKGFQNPNFIRPGLFNLSGLGGDRYETQTVYYGLNGEWTYQIPDFLGFTWASQLNTETIVGESKREYQNSLSQKLGANIGFGGFGLEVQETFEEESLVETYQKYASIYARQQIYRISVREYPDVLQSYLSSRALRLFAAGNAKAIVDTFGTHYMTSASFGGMRRFASTLNVRDESISTKLGQALKAEFEAETEDGKASGGADTSSNDATVQKCRDSMDVKSSIVIGGTYADGSEGDWIPSLFRNPSAIDFELASLAELIEDPTLKLAVQAEIDSRMASSTVTSKALALLMWDTLGSVENDSGSGANLNLATAKVTTKQGWRPLGQYGRGSTGDVYNWNPSGSKGLLIRNAPDSTQELVKKPDGIQYRWGKSDGFGLYEMTSSDSNYHALSGFFFRNNNAPFEAVENNAMVHTSLTVDAAVGAELWNDGGSGARDDANVYRVYYGPPDNDKIRIMQQGVDANGNANPEAFFFHTYQGGGIAYKALDFSKCQFVDNVYINPPS